MDASHHYDNEPDVLSELSPPPFEYYHGYEGGAGDVHAVQHRQQFVPEKVHQHVNMEWNQSVPKNDVPVATKPAAIDVKTVEPERSQVTSMESEENVQNQSLKSQSVFPSRTYKHPAEIDQSPDPQPRPFVGRSVPPLINEADRHFVGESLRALTDHVDREKWNSSIDEDISSPSFNMAIAALDKSKLLSTPTMAASPSMNLFPYMCPQCQKTFPTPLKLRQHIACHSLEKTFVCDICGRGFARKQTLTRHIMHRHVTEKPHVCPVCSKGYPQKYLLKQHMLKHTPQEQQLYGVEALEHVKVDYAALIASTLQENSAAQDSESKDGSETSSSKDTIIYKSDDGETSQGGDKSTASSTSNKADKPHGCEICGKRFAEKLVLDQHMINHSVGKPYKCNLCDTEFILHRMLVKHCMTVHLGDRPYVCEICNQAFGKTSTLKRHMFTHSKVKPHACNVCGRAFTREYSLQLHMANHTGEKPFKCADCGKGFASNSRLTMHFRSQHVEIAKFGCGECGMTFAQEINLKKHATKKHGAPNESPQLKKNPNDDDGELKCKICSKVFSARATLNRHLLMHSLERPFVCEFCDKRFTAQIGLTQHMFIHADDNPYTCKECGKGFTHRKGLQGHMMLHTGELPHICDICGEGFRRLDSLRRHKKRDHIETGDPGDKHVAQLFRGPKPVTDRYEKLDVKKYFGMSKLQKAGKVNESSNGDNATITTEQTDDADDSDTPADISPSKSQEDSDIATKVSAEMDEYVRKTISACEKNLSLVHENFPVLSEQMKSSLMELANTENSPQASQKRKAPAVEEDEVSEPSTAKVKAPVVRKKPSAKVKAPVVKTPPSVKVKVKAPVVQTPPSAKVKAPVVQIDNSESSWRA